MRREKNHLIDEADLKTWRRRIIPAPRLLVSITLCAFLILSTVTLSLTQASGPVRGEKDLLLDTPTKLVAAFDFQAKTLAGKNFRLSDLKGQVVFLNFWATWCVPCLREMPAMERLYQKMKGKPFRMLAVNFDETANQIRRFTKGKKFTFDLVLDPGGSIGEQYNASQLPLTYLIDRKGNIVRRAIGARDWDDEVVVNMLNHMAEENPGQKKP